VAAEEFWVATGSDHIIVQATTVIPSGIASDPVEQITQWLHTPPPLPAINVLDTPETAEQAKGCFSCGAFGKILLSQRKIVSFWLWSWSGCGKQH